MQLNIHEIFYSIQGETTRSGFSSVFIRLAGCNLCCRWCDTPASLAEGTVMSLDSILDTVRDFPLPDHVTVTGGEPLEQDGALILMQRFLDEGYMVQLETNGSLPIAYVPRTVRKIADIKPPSSGEAGSFLVENLSFMGDNDEIKIVIADETDLLFTENFIREHLLDHPSVINLTPASGFISSEHVVKFILAAPWGQGRCRVRLNLQIHRILNLP